MSLDLFFVPRKPTFEERRATDFKPNPGMTRVRKTLVADLVADYPPTRLEGDETVGYLADFPLGDLRLTAGYVSWTLHGVTDEAPVHAVVDWFFRHGHVCEDPQDAGFANRYLKPGSERVTLDSYEDLVGGKFVGLRLQREWGYGLGLDWLLADGSTCSIDFVTFRACRLPDVGPLVEQTVVGIDLQRGDASQGVYDTLRVFFPDDRELVVENAVCRKTVVIRLPAKTVG